MRVGSFRNQLKHVVRRLMRAPMFTIVTLVTIAIGIGANSAIFSVTNGVLLKPLPYPEPERLVSVRQTAPGLGIADVDASPSDYFTFRDESRTFQQFGIWNYDSVSITGTRYPRAGGRASMSLRARWKPSASSLFSAGGSR